MTAHPVDGDFLRLADPFRRELLAHCYRMLGSVHDAEDLVQETYLRAWRLQHLPPRQRAVLILRDVLRWRAAEVAEAVGTTTTAINSILQRARAQLRQVAPAEDEIIEPTTPDQRELLDRYVTAFENKDIAAIEELFTADAVWEMPPFPGWYQGPANIGRLVTAHCPGGPGDMRLVPTEANGQPAFAMYLRGDDGDFHPFQLHVLTVTSSGVARVTSFLDVRLFAAFGLPQTRPS